MPQIIRIEKPTWQPCAAVPVLIATQAREEADSPLLKCGRFPSGFA